MLSGMNKKKLENKIAGIKQAIAGLGHLRPGTLYERYSVCGKKGCRCSRAKMPQEHGPYHYLSYTFEGKSHTEFVSARRVADVKNELRNYGELMRLVKELIDCSISLAKLRRKEYNIKK